MLKCCLRLRANLVNLLLPCHMQERARAFIEEITPRAQRLTPIVVQKKSFIGAGHGVAPRGMTSSQVLQHLNCPS